MMKDQTVERLVVLAKQLQGAVDKDFAKTAADIITAETDKLSEQLDLLMHLGAMCGGLDVPNVNAMLAKLVELVRAQTIRAASQASVTAKDAKTFGEFYDRTH